MTLERVLSRRGTFDQALTDFDVKIHGLAENAVDGRSYILVEQLRAWMRDTNHTNRLDNKYTTNTNLLLHAAYLGCAESDKENFVPIDASYIANPGRKCCVLVFSILLELKLGHLIDRVARSGVLDEKLPVSWNELKDKFKGVDIPDSDRVATDFNRKQWKYCPAFFTMNMDDQFFEDRIIPVCRKEHICEGGTAHVWQIVVRAEFVDPKLRSFLDVDENASYNDNDYGHCYLFALKTFDEGNFHHFEDEKTAFDGLKMVPGVIRRLGCYSHRTHAVPASQSGQGGGRQAAARSRTTMNLVLEYGTYDLRHIFGLRSPPVFPTETIAFWKSLFEVANAVYGIHEFKHGGTEFNGWHADIKPENIIEVRDKLRLADPGFACFKKKNKTQDKGDIPRTQLFGGTETYGAPEVFQTAVNQTIDTWSLACVFSIAATWVVLGYQGVHQYQLVREKALGNLLQTISDDAHPLLRFLRLPASTKPDKTDCFHDGTDVLSEVTSWHALLKESSRKTDPVTDEVIDLIDRAMLLQDPKQRVGSRDLCEKLNKIVQSAQRKISEADTNRPSGIWTKREHIEDLLKQIDKEAATPASGGPLVTVVTPPTPGQPLNRSALKVQMDHLTLQKTSCRFKTIAEPRSRAIPPNTIPEAPSMANSLTIESRRTFPPPRTPTESIQPVTPDRPRVSRKPTLSRPSRQSTFGLPSRSNTVNSTLTHRKTPPTPTGQVTQNVFQARETIERGMRHRVPLFRRGPAMDEDLSKHFKKQKRDILFLVDDAESMAEHWDAATYLLETLVLKAHGQDPDGPDLAFFNDSAKVERGRQASDFRKKMESVRPRQHTNITTALKPIFQHYLGIVKRSYTKSLVRSLTIIILTDGLWQGVDDHDEINTEIEMFYKNLEKEMGYDLRHRQVSIQFIQLGDDDEARERLRRLDDDTPYRGIPDNIDYEKFTISGDVMKMLLGSFVDKFDAMNVEEGSISPGESPPAQATGFPSSSNAPLGSIGEELYQLPFPTTPTAQIYEMPASRTRQYK